MAEKPLYIAFVWHMHQPLYKNGAAGKYLLPWVRMHGIKDYYDMVALLENYPNIHQTFNLTPVLIMQIEDYVKNNATDVFLEVTLKKATELNKEDKFFILYNFFMVNWENMLPRFPRYVELLEKRGRHITRSFLNMIREDFSTQDYLDLQVLFNLVWFDPIFLEQEPLKSLVQKGRNFTEADKEVVIKKQREVLSMIIPEYRKLQDAGQIEVTTSPFYHPILPLIYNTDIGKIPSPQIPLPAKRFSAPRDVQRQIEKAVEFYKERFGRAPQGMWPSEGSVCEEILPVMEEAGIKWTATDEGILEGSLGKNISRDTKGNVLNPELLYKPYRFQWNGHSINLVFRDHLLSDLIGFTYAKWKTEEAVNDFIKRLEFIQQRTSRLPGDYLVSIILDGENAWEFYPNDGRDFLNGIYFRLNAHQSLKCVSVWEFLSSRKVVEVLGRVFPGSWINKNFEIWIGDEEENTAWDYLHQAREFLANYEGGLEDQQLKEKSEALSKAWEEIYAAEGSDWNWWYGDQHSSGYDDAFDFLYRQHLSNVYSIVGVQPPGYLEEPITLPVKSIPPATLPVDLIHPVLDGKITDYYEWLSSGSYEIRKTGGTMHQAESIVRAIYYGFDMENLYIRLDLHSEINECREAQALSFAIDFISPVSVRLKFSIGDNTLLLMSESREEKRIGAVAINKIIEIKIPFADLGLKLKDEIKFIIAVLKNGMEMEHWPTRAPITLTLPSSDYMLEHWSV